MEGEVGEVSYRVSATFDEAFDHPPVICVHHSESDRNLTIPKEIEITTEGFSFIVKKEAESIVLFGYLETDPEGFTYEATFSY